MTTATCGAGTGAKGTATYGSARTPVHQLLVRVEAGRAITLCVRSWHVRVHNIQVQVHDTVRAPTHRHRTVFASKQLTRGYCTLADYGIGEGSTLDLLGRLCGGRQKATPRTGTSTSRLQRVPAAPPRCPTPPCLHGQNGYKAHTRPYSRVPIVSSNSTSGSWASSRPSPLGTRLNAKVVPAKWFQCSNKNGPNKKSSKLIYPPTKHTHSC